MSMPLAADFCHEILYHIVSVGPVSQDILPPEQHLQLGVLEAVPELPQPVPGIFLQET